MPFITIPPGAWVPKGFGRIRPSSPRPMPLALPNSLEYLELGAPLRPRTAILYLATNLFRALAFHFKLLTARRTCPHSRERFLHTLDLSSSVSFTRLTQHP